MNALVILALLLAFIGCALADGYEHHQKYFQYVNVPGKKQYDFGYKRGNEYHHISRYEQVKGHRFRTKVKWNEPKEGHGQHYWEYNHAPKYHDKHEYHHNDHHDVYKGHGLHGYHDTLDQHSFGGHGYKHIGHFRENKESIPDPIESNPPVLPSAPMKNVLSVPLYEPSPGEGTKERIWRNSYRREQEFP